MNERLDHNGALFISKACTVARITYSGWAESSFSKGKGGGDLAIVGGDLGRSYI
jgi:hypothetical protein